MKLVVNLNSNVEAFHATPEQVAVLCQALPQYEISMVDSKETFLEALPDADVVVTWIFKPDWYALAPKLRAVHTPAAGNDWAKPDPSDRVMIHYGCFHGPIMRESLLAMILHFNHDIAGLMSRQREHDWQRSAYSHTPRLFEQKAVVVGYGGIGRSCADLLRAFGCEVTGVRQADVLGDGSIPITHLPQVLPEADHVVFILPGGPQTAGIITWEHFELMKSSACVYNLGRGNCYAEKDLVRALKAGQIKAAGLDVFAQEPLPEDSELWDLDNVLIMPHASAISAAYLPSYFEELIPQLQLHTRP